jgi:hypothetical protein
MTTSKPPGKPQQNLQGLIEEYLAHGGQVTHCPPGPSDQLTSKHFYSMPVRKVVKQAKPGSVKVDP